MLVKVFENMQFRGVLLLFTNSILRTPMSDVYSKSMDVTEKGSEKNYFQSFNAITLKVFWVCLFRTPTAQVGFSVRTINYTYNLLYIVNLYFQVEFNPPTAILYTIDFFLLMLNVSIFLLLLFNL